MKLEKSTIEDFLNELTAVNDTQYAEKDKKATLAKLKKADDIFNSDQQLQNLL